MPNPVVNYQNATGDSSFGSSANYNDGQKDTTSWYGFNSSNNLVLRDSSWRISVTLLEKGGGINPATTFVTALATHSNPNWNGSDPTGIGVKADPLVVPGVESAHYHHFIGHVLDKDDDVLNLLGSNNGQVRYQQGSGVERYINNPRGGWPARTLHRNSVNDPVEVVGHFPGVWFPTPFWFERPVKVTDSKVLYYTRQPHYTYPATTRLMALPSGAGWVSFKNHLRVGSRQEGRLNVQGPDWFDLENLHFGPFPRKPDGKPWPTFQEDCGGVGWGAPDDPNKPTLFFTPQVQSYLIFRFPDDVDPTHPDWSSRYGAALPFFGTGGGGYSDGVKGAQDSRWSYGLKQQHAGQPRVPFHMDYVSSHGSSFNQFATVDAFSTKNGAPIKKRVYQIVENDLGNSIEFSNYTTQSNIPNIEHWFQDLIDRALNGHIFGLGSSSASGGQQKWESTTSTGNADDLEPTPVPQVPEVEEDGDLDGQELAVMIIPAGIAGLTVKFNADVLVGTTAISSVRLDWNFGDNTTKTLGHSDIVEHTYAEPGTYTVSVTATDHPDNTFTASDELTIELLRTPTLVSSAAGGGVSNPVALLMAVATKGVDGKRKPIQFGSDADATSVG
ncbi:MAG: PKD domain-containing protein [Opitutae bacterium]